MADTENTLILETTQGPVTIEMRPDVAPNHVARIKELVREGFYDGIVFHRVIPTASWREPAAREVSAPAAPARSSKAEFNNEPHVHGTTSMTRAASRRLRRPPVLHLLRQRLLPQQAIHGVEQGHPRAWRTSTRSSAAGTAADPDKIVKAHAGADAA